MVSGDFPIVSVWAFQSGTTWAKVASLEQYDSLQFEPRFLEAGSWEMVLPYDTVSQAITADRLYTVDWRGRRTTWCLDRFNPASQASGVPNSVGGRLLQHRGPTLTVGGPGALSLLGRELAWADPTLGASSQPATSPLTTGAAETVIRSLVSGNYVTRRGDPLYLPADGARGTTIRARPRFDNLLELVAKKAKNGGIGVDVGLVDTTSTRARLELIVWTPADKSVRVRLSERAGSLAGWSQTNTAPTATKALVTGAEGSLAALRSVVTTAAGDAAAATWGGHRVVYVQGPASYDAADITQAGTEALDTGVAVTNVALEALDSPGLMAFRDYQVGDKVMGQLSTGTTLVDVISSIGVTVGEAAPEVVPTFGDPASDEPMVGLAQLQRAMNRRIRLLEQRT
jgi:hypothetical protein